MLSSVAAACVPVALVTTTLAVALLFQDRGAAALSEELEAWPAPILIPF
jgi:hypothetical protein